MLKILKSTDPMEVAQITLAIYAQPGLGKTSTGYTAEAPLLFDFDGGSYRSQFRGDTVQISSWDNVDAMTAADLTQYKTVVVDTAGRALDFLTVSLIEKNPKLKGYGGALSLQGYGALKPAFVGWLRRLHSFGKDVILLTHMDEQRNGDELIERLDVQGGSKGEIYKSADAMARIQLVSGKRVLNFNPTDTAYGKNPAHLPIFPIPDFHSEPQFLAGVIAQIKTTLNKSSVTGLAEQARMLEMKESFEFLTTATEFTAKTVEMSKAEPKIKALLMDVAKAKGFEYNKRAKAFVVSGAAQ